MKIELPQGAFEIPDKNEIRTYQFHGNGEYFALEERADAPDEPKVRGHAAVFEKLTQIYPGIMEKISKGAFTESLSDDIRALWSHNVDFPLARTANKSLRVWEDDYGLAFEMLLNKRTSIGNDAYEHIKRGDVTQMSFGFRVKKEGWQKGENGQPHVRTLEKLQLLEVSPVVFPAYPQTEVAARQWGENLVKEIEGILAKAPLESFVKRDMAKIKGDLLARGII